MFLCYTNWKWSLLYVRKLSRPSRAKQLKYKHSVIAFELQYLLCRLYFQCMLLKCCSSLCWERTSPEKSALHQDRIYSNSTWHTLQSYSQIIQGVSLNHWTVKMMSVIVCTTKISFLSLMNLEALSVHQ